MRYIKPYKVFESDKSYGNFPKLHKSRFGIAIEEIYDLLVDITDEFDDIDYWIGDSSSSWIVDNSPLRENVFVIYFESNKPSWEAENLYHLEHYLNKGKLNQIRSYLKDYGLEVYAADYGEVDTQYEIVVCKKGTNVIKGQAYKDRYKK